MQKPWRSFQEADPGREYLALLSYLPLIRRSRALPRFLWYTFQITRQLRVARGLIGYAMEMRPLRGEFWTLSAWEGEEALREFVGQPPHGHVMRTLAPHMGATNFIRWRAQGSELPLNWEAAHARARRTWWQC
jgi:hypothetical protein